MENLFFDYRVLIVRVSGLNIFILTPIAFCIHMYAGGTVVLSFCFAINFDLLIEILNNLWLASWHSGITCNYVLSTRGIRLLKMLHFVCLTTAKLQVRPSMYAVLSLMITLFYYLVEKKFSSLYSLFTLH